jgi:HPt (histidine-containing phosphotransfer) domain-containing protein
MLATDNGDRSDDVMDVLDQDALNALRNLDDGDEDLLAELIDIFLRDAPTRLTAIRGAIAREDWPELVAAAHSLKGSSGSLGAVQMADLCGRLERQGRTGTDRREAELVFRELERQSELVREALQRERG